MEEELITFFWTDKIITHKKSNGLSKNTEIIKKIPFLNPYEKTIPSFLKYVEDYCNSNNFYIKDLHQTKGNVLINEALISITLARRNDN